MNTEIALMAWTINIIYLLSLLPQLLINYRRSSVKGVSPLMVVCSWNGYAFYAIYAYGQALPLAYRVCVPLWLCVATLWVIQKSYYTKGLWWGLFYALNAGFLLCYFAVSLRFTYLSLWAGWLATLLWGIYFIPQIIANVRRGSAKGLSKSFIVLTLCGAGLEVGYGYVVGLPLPTITNAWRELLFVTILYGQTKWYRLRRKKSVRKKIARIKGYKDSAHHSVI